MDETGRRSEVRWVDEGFNDLVEALNATPFSDDLKDRLWGELMTPSCFPASEHGIAYCALPAATNALDPCIGVKLGRKGVALALAFRRIAGSATDEMDEGHCICSAEVTAKMISAGVAALEDHLLDGCSLSILRAEGVRRIWAAMHRLARSDRASSLRD